MSKLKGLNLKLFVSDPWEFGEGPFNMELINYTVLKNDRTNLLLKLDQCIVFKNQKCEYFVASARRNENLINLLDLKQVTCNLICISNEKAKSPNSINTNDWRGGISLIGSIDVR